MYIINIQHKKECKSPILISFKYIFCHGVFLYNSGNEISSLFKRTSLTFKLKYLYICVHVCVYIHIKRKMEEQF